MLKGILVLSAGLVCVTAMSQELNCRVEFNVDRIDISSRQSVESLRETVADYMNTTSFGTESFQPHERIDCRLFFALKSCDGDNFTADLQVQSSRPVYNSTYTTQLVNFKEDDLKFVYRAGTPLTFSQMSIDSQLTSVLDFYAYLILAMDRDSFSKRGGEEYFRQLERVVHMGQSSGGSGWRQYESHNSRGAVLAAWTNPATASLRDLTYSYHREGLDVMESNPESGRRTITAALKDVLSDVYATNAMSVGLTMWRDAKLGEVVSMYAHDGIGEGKEISKMLKEMFPSDVDLINRIEDR